MGGTAVPEYVDVLIIGAGISGIGAAHSVRTDLPGKSFLLVEARDAIGGTWDLFRYPGVRSDSDLYTFGYEFRPWTEPESIARGDRILAYLDDTIREEGIRDRIRFGSRVTQASWSSADARWRVTVETDDGAETAVIACRWIICATGYYRYDAGYTPDLPGLDRFSGPVVHPQHWPAELDHRGKRVVVVGSGATAVTLLPALAGEAAHVTMLQRTPTYVLPISGSDALAQRLRRLLGDALAHAVIRRKNIAVQRLVWLASRRMPTLMRRVIRSVNRRSLPPGYPVDEHFSPPYDPWDQRLCFAPDGDFFRVIRDGTADIVTDRIATFTEGGIELESGRRLDADIVVTATGLVVEPFGGIALTVDGEPVELSERVAYRGVLLDGVPNLAYVIGYTNASWTLKVGLACGYVTRLIAELDANGWTSCRPLPPAGDVATRPLLDFGAGYVRRAVEHLPRQGDRDPWRTSTGYADDIRLLRRAPVTDPLLRFDRADASA